MDKNCISLKKITKRKLNEKYISRRPRIQCDKIPRLIFLRPSPRCRSPTPACRAAGHSRRRPSACRPTRPPSVQSLRRTAPARTRSSRWQSRTGGCGRSSGGDSVTALRDRVRWQPDRWVRTVFRWRQCDSPEGQSTVTAGQVGADGLQVATVWQPWETEYGDSRTGGYGRSSGGDSVTALRDRVRWQPGRWVGRSSGGDSVTALRDRVRWQPDRWVWRSSGGDSVTALRDRVRWQPDRWVRTVFRWRQCDSPERQSTVTAGQVGADGLQVATVWQPWETEYGDSRTGGCGRSSGGDSVTALRDRVRWQLDRWVWMVFRWRQCDSPEGQSTVTAGQVGLDGLQVATVWQPWETEYGDSRTGGSGRSSGGDTVTALRDRVRWQPDRWVRTVFRWRQWDSPEGQSTVTAGQVGADGLQVATVWQPWGTEYGDSRTGGCGRSSGGDSVTALRDRVRWQPDRWVRTVFRWRQCDSPERQSTVTAGQVGLDGLQVATVWQPWGTEYGDSRTGGSGRSSGGDSVTALRDRVRWQPDRWVRTVFRWRQCDSPEGQSTVTAGQVGADGLQVATVWQPWGTEYGDSRTGGCGRSSGGDSVTALRDRVRWQPDRWVWTVFRWRQCDSPERQSTVTAGQVGADGLQVATVWQPWGTEYGDSRTGGCGRSSGGDSVTALRDRVRWQPDRWVRTVFRWRQCDSPEGQSTVTAGQVGADGLQVATVWQPWGTEYGDSRTGGCGRSSGGDSVTALRDRVRWQPGRWVRTVFRWRQCDSPERQSTVTAGQVGLDGLQVATVWQPWETEYGDSRAGGCGRSSGGDSVTALRDRVRWQPDRWVRTVFRWRQCDSPERQSTVTAGQVGADGLQVATVWQPWETEYGDSWTGGSGRSSGGDSVTALMDRSTEVRTYLQNNFCTYTSAHTKENILRGTTSIWANDLTWHLTDQH